jgi:adenine-specific DNA glycosylase
MDQILNPKTIAQAIVREEGKCWRVQCMCNHCPLKTFCNTKQKRTQQELLTEAKKYAN